EITTSLERNLDSGLEHQRRARLEVDFLPRIQGEIAADLVLALAAYVQRQVLANLLAALALHLGVAVLLHRLDLIALHDQVPVLADELAGVALHATVQVLLRVEKDLFRPFFILETQLVEVLRAAL